MTSVDVVAARADFSTCGFFFEVTYVHVMFIYLKETRKDVNKTEFGFFFANQLIVHSHTSSM